MRVSQVKELFRSLLQEYFAGAIVLFANQSRVAKQNAPLIVLTPGNVRRDRDSINSVVEGIIVASYPSRISIQVDLYTKGLPVIDPDTGEAIASENTAMDDILALLDFLNSPYVIEWCNTNDVAIGIEGEPMDLTGIVNDNNYEYRSRLTVLFYFTQNAIGHTATLSEDSIKDFGIVPEFKPSSAGGGSEELASMNTGYFTEVEIKEEKKNE